MKLAECVPWRNATLAYDRNRLADQILRDDNVPISFIRTWDYDADQWMQHVPGNPATGGMDCTHYCNPSNVTANWAKATLDVVADLTSTSQQTYVSAPAQTTEPVRNQASFVRYIGDSPY